MERKKLEGFLGMAFKKAVGQDIVDNKIVNIETYNLNLFFSNKHSADLIEKEFKWSPDLRLIVDLNNTGKCNIVIYSSKFYYGETIDFKKAIGIVEFVTSHSENKSFNLGVQNCNSSNIEACLSSNNFHKIAVFQGYKQENIL